MALVAGMLTRLIGLALAAFLCACDRAQNTGETMVVQAAPTAPSVAPTPISTPAVATLQAPPTSSPATPLISQQTRRTAVETWGGLARYRVSEQLARRELPNDAGGETSDLSGSIVFDTDGAIRPDESKLLIDLQTLMSDERRRDNYVRDRTIQTGRSPAADFVARTVEGLPWPLPAEGQAT